MKILIPTLGSRGDIQPYINLAQALSQKYHPVIATLPCWKGLVQEYGLDFAPLGPEIDIEQESSRLRNSSRFWIVGMIKTSRLVMKLMDQSSEELLKVMKDADLVIISHTYLGAAEAEYLKKPRIHITLQPFFLTDVTRKRTVINKIIGRCLSFMIAPFNKARKKLSLKRVNTMEELITSALNIIPLSQYIFSANPGWDKKHQLVGYWFTGEPASWQPPQELVRFLNEGEEPVIIALGAMSFDPENEEQRVRMFIDAVTKLNLRAVIQGFNNTMRTMKLPANVIHIGSVPHNWLFKRGKFIIHHGGFGTTAAAFQSGKPALVIPHILDQYLFAQKVAELKVGPKGIPGSKLTLDLLMERISEILRTGEYFTNAAELGKKVESEQGIDRTMELIDDFIVEHQTKWGSYRVGGSQEDPPGHRN